MFSWGQCEDTACTVSFFVDSFLDIILLPRRLINEKKKKKKKKKEKIKKKKRKEKNGLLDTFEIIHVNTYKSQRRKRYL